jgi:hypothetical protein
MSGLAGDRILPGGKVHQERLGMLVVSRYGGLFFSGWGRYVSRYMVGDAVLDVVSLHG